MANYKHVGMGLAAAIGIAVTAAPRAHAQDMYIDPDQVFDVMGGLHKIYDSPMSMLRTDGTLTWITSGSSEIRKYKGPLEDILQTELFRTPSDTYFTNMPATGPGAGQATYRGWLTNVYRINATSLLGFVHNEDQAPNLAGGVNNEDFAIGLAYSTDSGNSFRYLGTILDEHDSSKRGHNIKGTPYLIVEVGEVDYFYAYFNDLVDGEDTTSVARAKVSDVIAAASASPGRNCTGPAPQNPCITPWIKFNNGWGTEAGIGGRSTSINTLRWSNTHSDMAHNTSVDRYMWASVNDDETPLHEATDASILFSHDGLNWTGRTKVMVGPRTGGYPFFGADVGADATAYQIGREFQVYFGSGDNGNDWLSTANILLDPLSATLASENFNTTAVNAAPAGWSIFENGVGTVRAVAAPRLKRQFVTNLEENDVQSTSGWDRSLRLSDNSTSQHVSAVKGFTAHSGAVTVAFEFRVSDGSYQSFRLKGDGKTVDAARLYVLNGNLYWLDGSDQRHFVGNVSANRWYSLKLIANATTDTYSVWFDGDSTNTVPRGQSGTVPPIQLLANVGTIDAVAFNTGSSGTGSLWIDDLEIYR